MCVYIDVSHMNVILLKRKLNFGEWYLTVVPSKWKS